MNVKVILRENVPGLGKEGDTVTVAKGYARNYLIPKGLALEYSPKNISIIENERKIKERKKIKELKLARKKAEEISKIKVTIYARASENNVLYGSITTKDIYEALKEKGIEVNKKSIILEEPIKELGFYPVLIKLHPEVETRLKVFVEKKVV